MRRGCEFLRERVVGRGVVVVVMKVSSTWSPADTPPPPAPSSLTAKSRFAGETYPRRHPQLVLFSLVRRTKVRDDVTMTSHHL